MSYVSMETLPKVCIRSQSYTVHHSSPNITQSQRTSWEVVECICIHYAMKAFYMPSDFAILSKNRFSLHKFAFR